MLAQSTIRIYRIYPLIIKHADRFPFSTINSFAIFPKACKCVYSMEF
jgi:hypothetical protein